MGKFFNALEKFRKSEQKISPKFDQNTTVKSSINDIHAARLDTKGPETPTYRPPILDSRLDPRLVTLLEPQSITAELFKLLRAKIFCESQVCQGRTIMIASGQPLDGKSLVAANLALSIAQGIGQFVLLIDCDLRQPCGHLLFGLNPHQGLSEYLQNGTSVGPYLLKTPVPRLSLLPAGKPPSNPTDLLSSEKMHQLIEELRNRYHDRFIILDTPPACLAAETNFLSTLVDGILLVVRSNRTPKPLIMKTLNNIGRDKVLGVIFNASKEAQRDHRHYSRYYQSEK